MRSNLLAGPNEGVRERGPRPVLEAFALEVLAPSVQPLLSRHHGDLTKVLGAVRLSEQIKRKDLCDLPLSSAHLRTIPQERCTLSRLDSPLERLGRVLPLCRRQVGEVLCGLHRVVVAHEDLEHVGKRQLARIGRLETEIEADAHAPRARRPLQTHGLRQRFDEVGQSLDGDGLLRIGIKVGPAAHVNAGACVGVGVGVG